MADSKAVDLDYVTNHFSPIDPRLVGDGPLMSDGLWHAIDLMLDQCPVTKSDGQWFGCPHGGWVVNRYEDVMSVIHDTDTFSNRVKKGSGDWEPPQIPIDIDPPILVEYKRFLRPYFTMSAVSKFEPTAREIITRLLDRVIEAGHSADIAAEIAYPFSMRVQWSWLVGIDETDHDQPAPLHAHRERVGDLGRDIRAVPRLDDAVEQTRDDLARGGFEFRDR